MKSWMRRVRGAVRMGLIWAAGWALVGMLIELVHNVWPNPLGSLVDIWPAALGLPAFFGGLTFSTLLGIAARRRRFAELSLPRFAALGALGGVLVSLGPALLVAVGLASIKEPYSLWQVTLTMMVPIALVGATSAAGSLALARRAESRESLAAGENAAEMELAEVEASLRELHERE
jgi:hypothetical protein